MVFSESSELGNFNPSGILGIFKFSSDPEFLDFLAILVILELW